MVSDSKDQGVTKSTPLDPDYQTDITTPDTKILTKDASEIEIYKEQEASITTPYSGKGRLKNESISVRLFTTQKFDVGGNKKLFVITVDDDKPVRGFLVDEGEIEYNSKITQQINPNKHTEVYNWASELAKVFESIEQVRRNALLSFWRAGAFDKSVLSNPSIRRTMFQSAYPYAIEE